MRRQTLLNLDKIFIIEQFNALNFFCSQWFEKSPYPGKIIGNSEGEGGGAEFKTQFLKESMKQNWEVGWPNG